MKVQFFTTRRGDAPVQEYIESLGEAEKMRINAVLERIGEGGLAAAVVPLRQIRGKLWEIKVQPHRVFYAVAHGGVLWLLHAYRKQGQKAPRVEVETALVRMQAIFEAEE